MTTDDRDRSGPRIPAVLPALRSAFGLTPSNRSVVPYTPPGLPVRPAPHVPLPFDTSWRRGRLARFREKLDNVTAATEAATRLYSALGALEAARQEGERIHAARRLLPIAFETDRTTLLAPLVRAQADLDAVRGDLEQRRIEREKQSELLPLQMEQLRLTLEHELAQARAVAEAQHVERADQRVRRERRWRLEQQDLEMELAARRQAVAAPADNTPDAFRRHYAMGLEVHRNRGEADRRIEEIYMRAAAERRPLTDGEIEQVDQIADAASGAEDEVRRSSASDLK
jgi:hypothetical protein